MHNTLADFRIENDNVIFLQFANGKKYRVSPSDLASHLAKKDLARVRKAIALRSSFIHRVLPPTAVIVLLAGVAGLGSYDAAHLSQRFQSVPVAQPEQIQSEVSVSPPTVVAPSTVSTVSADAQTPAIDKTTAATPITATSPVTPVNPATTVSTAPVVSAALNQAAAVSGQAIELTIKPASNAVLNSTNDALESLTRPLRQSASH